MNEIITPSDRTFGTPSTKYFLNQKIFLHTLIFKNEDFGFDIFENFQNFES